MDYPEPLQKPLVFTEDSLQFKIQFQEKMLMIKGQNYYQFRIEISNN